MFLLWSEMFSSVQEKQWTDPNEMCFWKDRLPWWEFWQFIQTYIYFGAQQCTDGNAVAVEEVFSSVSSLFRHLQFPR